MFSRCGGRVLEMSDFGNVPRLLAQIFSYVINNYGFWDEDEEAWLLRLGVRQVL